MKKTIKNFLRSENKFAKIFAALTMAAIVFTVMAPGAFARFWRTMNNWDQYSSVGNPWMFAKGHGYGDNGWGYGYGYGYNFFGQRGNNRGYYFGEEAYENSKPINPGELPGNSTINPPGDPNNVNSITMTDTVTLSLYGAQIILPQGLEITESGGDGIFDATGIKASVGNALSSDFSGNTLNATIDFGETGTKLLFSMPVKLIIPMPGSTPNGTTVNIAVKHFGEGYTSSSLAIVPTATCAAGVATPSSSTAVVAGGVIEIYTCAASTFASFSPGGTPSAPSSGGGGGGGGGTKCGNKIKEGSEQCDDGNKINGDGCSSLCRKEVVTPIKEVVQKITTTFQDTAGHWGQSYIEQAAGLGIFQGKTSTSFAPNDNITRAEFTKAVLKAFGYEIPSSVSVAAFDDIATDAWYATYITAASDAGLITGYSDGTFRPNSTINRAEALKVILVASKLSLNSESTKIFTDTTASAWYMEFIRFAFDKGVVSGYSDGSFGPEKPITRAEAAKIIIKILELK